MYLLSLRGTSIAQICPLDELWNWPPIVLFESQLLIVNSLSAIAPRVRNSAIASLRMSIYPLISCVPLVRPSVRTPASCVLWAAPRLLRCNVNYIATFSLIKTFPLFQLSFLSCDVRQSQNGPLQVRACVHTITPATCYPMVAHEAG